MQFKLIVFIIVIIILAALGWYFYNQAIIEEFPRASGDAVFYEISEIKTKDLNPGVYVCMNGKVFSSEEVMKVNKEGRFSSIFGEKE